DELFYRPVWDEPAFRSAPAPRAGGMIRMRELLVHPPGEDDTFRPLRHNGRRRAPVPILMLNATSLNTGHAWRFQAVEMGEWPRDEQDWLAIDKNARLLSTPYDQIVRHHADVPLGIAVAASACVPALFQPLALSGLFEYGEDRQPVRVQLVDGGVHDNQGVCSLFDLGCGRLVVS